VYDIAKKYRFTDAEILAAGYDVPRFNHRLIFPIFDLDKNIVAISGRVLDNETQPKYTATPNSDYYKKGLFLYGLKDVVKGKPITLVEGNLDYIRLHSSGINALAQLGSALTKMQCYLIKSLTHNIILMYDGDEAGRKASMHNILPLIECGLKVFVASLPDGYDPDSYFKTGVNPIPVVQKGLEYYLREPHMQAVSRCLRTLSKLMDDSVRSEYITQLSTASGLSESSIQSELRKIHNEK
jgi:DNA primase